jgi:hypothetical protein
LLGSAIGALDDVPPELTVVTGLVGAEGFGAEAADWKRTRAPTRAVDRSQDPAFFVPESAYPPLGTQTPTRLERVCTLTAVTRPRATATSTPRVALGVALRGALEATILPALRRMLVPSSAKLERPITILDLAFLALAAVSTEAVGPKLGALEIAEADDGSCCA